MAVDFEKSQERMSELMQTEGVIDATELLETFKVGLFLKEHSKTSPVRGGS